MGVVARAHHLDLDQPVAIKLLLPQALQNEAMVIRFRREARAMVQLKSEHVSKVFDVGTLENGAPYMVMEYLEGKDLGQWLRDQGPLEPGFAVDLMLQACEALAEAHAAGIVHRDIKPANFFLTRGPDGRPLLKVLDFGISKALNSIDDGFTTSQAFIGTPSYMSPEQMHSSKYVDARTDIWALGVVLYELVSGCRPFRGDSYAGLCLAVTMAAMQPLEVSDLPAGLVEIIERCLRKQPSERFGSVAEIAAALAPYAATAAQGERSSERAARILAFAGTSDGSRESTRATRGQEARFRAESGMPPTISLMEPTVSEARPTVSQRPPSGSRASAVSQAPPTVSQAPPEVSQASLTVMTVEIAGPAPTRVDARMEPTARRMMGRGARYVLIASIAIVAGLALVLLLDRGKDLPGAGGEQPGGGVAHAAREAPQTVVPAAAPGPSGDSGARAATEPEPVRPPPGADADTAGPPTPAVKEPASKPATAAAGKSPAPRGRDAPRSRVGSSKDNRARQKARPDKPANEDVYDDFD
jgi:serine/threonine-protein kinase